jgi:hypothetical protein
VDGDTCRQLSVSATAATAPILSAPHAAFTASGQTQGFLST